MEDLSLEIEVENLAESQVMASKSTSFFIVVASLTCAETPHVELKGP